jgi:hypothetical protein
MSKAFRFWTDTETTGFGHYHDQILELAGVIDDPEGNIVEEFEFKIKLKHNILPGPKAMMVNKINPYSKKWVSESLVENEVAKRFDALVRKYTTKAGVKPIFTAYSADFDKDKCAVMLSHNGLSFSKIFNKSVIDPLVTARKLTSTGKLKTKDQEYYGKISQSAKLGDVADALGIKFEGESHRALADAKVMRLATKKLFKLATGYEMDGLSASPKNFEIGNVVKLITDSKSSGAKVRHVYILANNVEREYIIVIDEDDIKQNGGFKDSSVRQFNYSTIVGEVDADFQAKESIEKIALEKKDAAEVLMHKKIKADSDDHTEFDVEESDFSIIEQVQEYMSKSPDKKTAYEYLSKELEIKFKGNKSTTKFILTRAESLACAKGLTGWTRELFPQIGVRVLENIMKPTELRVALHPKGHYTIGLNYEHKGIPAKELRDCKTKKDIQTFINAKIGKSPEMVEFINSLPNKEHFEDPKHPSVLEEDFIYALDKIKVGGADENIQAGISAILHQLQKISPKVYSKYTAPIDPTEINDVNYWMAAPVKKPTAGGSGGGGVFNSDSEALIPASGNESKTMQTSSQGRSSDHVKPGEKLSQTPCALCGRALSADISVQYSMGPTCRKNLSAAEDSEGSLESFRDEYRAFIPSSPQRPGDLFALKYKDNSGRESEILAEFVSVSPRNTQVIDRRRIRKLLNAGIDSASATYLSVVKLPHGTVTGIAKLRPTEHEYDDSKGPSEQVNQ